MQRSLGIRFSIAIAVLSICGLALAQEPSDPPGRVARLQFVQGQISMQPGGVDDWIPVSMNRPLTTGDRLWADEDSRAEVTMGSAALRLSSESSLTLTNLTDGTTQLELDQGTMSLAVRYLNPGDIVEVDTPNFAYTVSQPGEYVFKVIPDQDQSWVLVRSGGGQVTGGEASLAIDSGIWYQFGQGQSLMYTTAEMTPRDEFEQWCAAREATLAGSPSARYVARGTIGYEALDGNGIWAASPMYGSIWYPNVDPTWAPYHTGHWAWVEPWGWTWVDDAPWGFAPFHYGRWVNDGGRWGWIPGPTEGRPMYAPALVAWVGGASIGVGGGGVVWIPLGWHDPFIPTYHVSAAYAMNVNVSNSRVVNVTVINNYYSTTNVQQRNVILVNNVHYENVTVKGAATGVPANAFASGRPVAQAAVVIPPGAMGRASFTATAAVAPTKEAVLGGHTPSAAAPVRLVVPKQIVAKTAPPAPKVSFEQQRPLLEKSGGVPLTAAAHAELRASSPAPKSGRPAVAVVSAKAAAAPAKPAPARPGPAPAAATGKPGVPPTPAVKPVAPAGKPAAAAETGKPAALPTPAGKPANAPMVVGGKQVTPPTTAVKPGVPPPAKKTPTPPPKKKDEKEKEGK